MNIKSSLLFGWLLLAIPAAVQAQFTYTTNNGGITITRYTGTSSVVVIPDTITGLPVTVIGGGAFYYWTNLTTVIIPSSVTSIGDSAFGGCHSLTGVIIPNSVTSIGYSAFRACTSLTDVTIPNCVTIIAHAAFSHSTGLTPGSYAATSS